MTQAIPPKAWAHLCRTMMQRAMRGDHRALAWVDRHKPAPDAAETPEGLLGERLYIWHHATRIAQAALSDPGVSFDWLNDLYGEEFLDQFTRAELNVLVDHLDARQHTPAGLPVDAADSLRRQLAAALKADQDPDEVARNRRTRQWNRHRREAARAPKGDA